MTRSRRTRTRCIVLAVVLFLGGSGASALDLALYHFGAAAVASTAPHVAGTDAPRPHGDLCVLLEWTAHGPYTVELAPPVPRPVAAASDHRPLRPGEAPKSGEPLPSARPRAPPSPFA